MGNEGAEQSQLPSQEGGETVEELTIDQLPESLGFVETEELTEIRKALTEAMTSNSEDVKELATRYHLLVQKIDSERHTKYLEGEDVVEYWMMGDEETRSGSTEESVLAKAAALGFEETEEMREARIRVGQITQDSKWHNREAINDVAIALAQQTEEYRILRKNLRMQINERFQIGFTVAMALIRRDAGRLKDYIDDLEEVWEASPNLEYLVPTLRAELRRATAELDAR